MDFGPWAWVNSRINPDYSSSSLRSSSPLFAEKEQKGCFGWAVAECCWEAGTCRWHTVCTGLGALRCPCKELHRSERSAQSVVDH